MLRATCLLALAGALLALTGSTAVAHSRDPIQAIVASTNGRPIAQLRMDGRPTVAVADGAGGWYVGGTFTRVNGVPRLHLAHIDSDGSVDRHWRASVWKHSGAFAFTVSGLAIMRNRVYVSGTLLRANGQFRFGLAAFGRRDGVLDRHWRPPIAGSALIALVAAGRRIVLAGSFSVRSGSTERFDLVAVDAESGAVDPTWGPRLTPAPSPSTNGEVTAIAAAPNRVYVLGAFRGPHGVEGLIAIARSSGRLVLRVHPPHPTSSSVQLLTLAATANDVFVGGTFKSLGGFSRPGLAALDPTSGKVKAHWLPAVCCGKFIAATPSILLVGGVALDAHTGMRVRRWTFPPSAGEVRPLAFSGSRLLVAVERYG
jgi:hypothetical protein